MTGSYVIPIKMVSKHSRDRLRLKIRQCQITSLTLWKWQTEAVKFSISPWIFSYYLFRDVAKRIITPLSYVWKSTDFCCEFFIVCMQLMKIRLYLNKKYYICPFKSTYKIWKTEKCSDNVINQRLKRAFGSSVMPTVYSLYAKQWQRSVSYS